MCWSQGSVDAQVSHYWLNLGNENVWAVKARLLSELVVVGQAVK